MNNTNTKGDKNEIPFANKIIGQRQKFTEKNFFYTRFLQYGTYLWLFKITSQYSLACRAKIGCADMWLYKKKTLTDVTRLLRVWPTLRLNITSLLFILYLHQLEKIKEQKLIIVSIPVLSVIHQGCQRENLIGSDRP